MMLTFFLKIVNLGHEQSTPKNSPLRLDHDDCLWLHQERTMVDRQVAI